MTDRSTLIRRWTCAALLACAHALAPAAFAQVPAPARVDTAASCTASCHLGWGKKKHVHAAGTRGTSCTKACHQPLEAGRHAFKPAPANQSAICFSCHDEETRSEVHRPFKRGSCTTCHDPHQSDHAMLLKKPVPEVCQDCHEPGDGFKGKTVHGPVAKGDCLGCHGAHAAERAGLLAKAVPDLCFSCHSTALKNAKGRAIPAMKRLYEDKAAVRHRPFAEGKCGSCHVPHASEAGALLAKPHPEEFYAPYSAKAYGLCLECHKARAFEEARTLADTGFRNGNLNLHFRHVNKAKGRTCGACHDAHGSAQPRLVRSTFAFGTKSLALRYEKTATGGSCTTSCHSPVKYDRCLPVPTTMKTTPSPGRDAAADELARACEKEKAEAPPPGLPAEPAAPPQGTPPAKTAVPAKGN